MQAENTLSVDEGYRVRRRACALIIPVENQVRELDAKLLLACVAAEQGFAVILGSRSFIHFRMPFLPRGVYLAKSMRGLSRKMFRIIRDLGDDIVAWDEEGLVRYPEPVYHQRRLSAKTAKDISILFAWGPDNAEVFRRYSEMEGIPIHSVGNPRIDLLRPEVSPYFAEDVHALRQRFGEFVLINTNFGTVNSFVPSLSLVEPGSGNGTPVRILGNAEGMTSAFAEGFAAHKQALFAQFQDMIPVLSRALPDHTVVVRPHPAEKHDPWQAIAERHPNVRVVHEGNVVPWLMAARVLIHNGCTTAVEAAVLGTPAVAFQPVRSDEFDFPLPNAVSHRASSAEEVARIVRSVVDGRLGPLAGEERYRLMEPYLTSLQGPLAVDRMVDVLKSAGYAAGPRRSPGAAQYAGAWVRANTRALLKQVNAFRVDHRGSSSYHTHRFPSISAHELQRRIDRFARQLGRFAGVRARPLSPHVFRIERSA